MTVTEASASKFQFLLRKINRLIEEDGLRPGDKIPSERELSERLQAGRSSIREVLRSLELLGIITTRRGEGTFLQPHHKNHLVDLLAGYILRDIKSRQDLLEMRELLEVGSIQLAVQRREEEELMELKKLLDEMKQMVIKGIQPNKALQEFHALLIKMANNYLLTRIWYPIVHYVKTIETEGYENIVKISEDTIRLYEQLVEAVSNQEGQLAIDVMERLCENRLLHK
ncbi:FadR/GntR family transcriptional regulator [Hazenella coriacea]|uniref:GntR family transcriptional regulator n=1 Tax=Hazenella coriacea TaxID=1179467 RepID=A0A4R3LA88_9BACL|nr:FCD domain-containing protein [Hazenella coriacea]TCS96753.1 GntR family transcriptional regulator [Hazenella coriacea]